MRIYKFTKRQLVIFTGIILIILTGCSNSNQNQENVESTVTSVDYEDMRDYNYYELLSLIDETIQLATNIKQGEIKMDSDISKKTIEELHPAIMEKIEFSRSDIIPNLEENRGNEYYSYFIDVSEDIVNLLKKGIENRDYSIGRELEGNVIELNKILKVISEEY